MNRALFSKREIKYHIGKNFIRSIDSLEKCIEKAYVVSFDIFDTLVKRNVYTYEDVHSLVYEEFFKKTNIAIADYKKLRVDAERQARKQSSEEEVTLDDIYQHMPLEKESDKELLKRIEQEKEVEVAVPDKLMKKMYEKAKQLGKKIIITSDMYLPEKTIIAILQKCGYQGYEKLFLSSTQLRCKSTGNLFEVIKQEYLNLEILHIGDDFKADFYMSKKHGMKAFLIDGRRHNLKYWKARAPKSVNEQMYQIVYSFLNNYAIEDADEPTVIGYEVLGPLLYGFCQWLHKQLEEEQIEKIFFLSREGKLLQEAYELMYPEDKRVKKYLQVSRLATAIPFLADAKNYDELILILRSLLVTAPTLKMLRVLCDLNQKEFEKKIALLGYDEQTVLYDIEKDRQQDIFELVKALGQKHFEEQKIYIKKYLRDISVSGKTAIVDIGWSGSMQKAIMSLNEESATILGYYLGVRNTEQNAYYQDMNRNGYLFSEGRNEDYSLMLRFTNEIIEMLFLNKAGSVKGYEENKGNIVPVLADSEFCEKQAAFVSCIQKSAIAFLRDINNGLEIRKSEILAPAIVMEAYARYAVYPQMGTLRTFKEFVFINGDVKKILPERGFLYYVLHPGQLKYEFESSCCKIWFLKGLFKLDFPYFKLLSGLTKIGIKSSYRKNFW